MPPLKTNCTMLAVGGAGAPDDFNGPSAGQARWAGFEECYYSERTTRRQGPGGLDVIVVRELWLSTSAFDSIGVAEGDLLTVDLGGRGRFVHQVRAIAWSRPPGLIDSVVTTKLDLGEGVPA